MATSCKKIVRIFLCLLTVSLVLARLDSYKEPWFSTKTPYFWLQDENEEIQEDSEMWLDFGQSSCQAIHLDAVFRHGARYPGLKWIKRMSKLHERLMKDGDIEKYSFLKSWTNPFPEEKEKLLTELGEEEHYELGSRFGKRFSLLLEDEMDNLKIVVSSKQRTQASASSFVEGLATSVPVTENDNVEPVIDDIALRFHDNCDKYKVSVDKNDSAMAEYHKFKKGPEVSSLCSEMTEKLGIPIDPDDVNTIFQLCALEEAVTDRDSDWCQFLNEENLQIIQYMNDLKQYWKKAYGYNITASMSCPLVSGMFQRFEDVIRKNEAGKDHNVATLQFGHAETLAPLYAALKLFLDEPQLKANNYKDHNNRQFQSSQILPFSANIALVLYECDSGDNGEGGGSDDPFSYYVKVLVNEVSIEIPACNDTLCTYEQFRDFYKHYADHCDFHGLCRVDENKHDEL